MLATCGATVWVDAESQLDAVTAVSGSGPAYFFLLIEALEAAAIEQGLPPATARRLAVATAEGAGCMAAAASEPPAELRAQVTSKGGTTAAALEVFESGGLRAMVSRAVAAATQRSARARAQAPTAPDSFRDGIHLRMRALLYVLDALFTLVLVAFLLRVILPLVDAGFRNPIGQAVLKVTDPLVLPLRRLFKPVGRFDVAAVVALVLVQLVATALLLSVGGVGCARVAGRHPAGTAVAARSDAAVLHRLSADLRRFELGGARCPQSGRSAAVARL